MDAFGQAPTDWVDNANRAVVGDSDIVSHNPFLNGKVVMKHVGVMKIVGVMKCVVP